MFFYWLILHGIGLAAEPVRSGAEISTAARLGLQDCIDSLQSCSWIHFRDTAVVSPWVHATPSETVTAKTAVDVRLHGNGQGFGLESSPEPQPWSLRVEDLWVASRGNKVELRVGVFRTAWGVANGISVVDTINPIDLENPTLFDRRLSVPTASISTHSSTFSASALIMPFFVPAALPNVPMNLTRSATALFNDQLNASGEIQVDNLQTRPAPPDNSLVNSTLGLQLRWTPPAGDFSVSWHHGRDSLPQVNGELLLVGYQTNTDQVDVGVPLTYPKMDVFGCTARAPIGANFNGWAETTLTLPEYTFTYPSSAQLDGLVKLGTLNEMPNPIPSTTTQDGTPLVKYIFGIERSFGPTRFVGQWMRGFLTERSQTELRNYGLLGMQWTITDVVRIDLNGGSNLSGHIADIKFQYLYEDTVEIVVGGTHFDGDYNSTFGHLREASNLFTRVSMKF